MHIEAIERARPSFLVAVAFVVTVPPTTPLNDDVYISTDASGWNPQAIKLDRIDGQKPDCVDASLVRCGVHVVS